MLTAKQRKIVAAATFLIVQALFVFVGWLGGYDFDHRDEMVALWGVFSLFIGGGLALLVLNGELP